MEESWWQQLRTLLIHFPVAISKLEDNVSKSTRLIYGILDDLSLVLAELAAVGIMYQVDPAAFSQRLSKSHLLLLMDFVFNGIWDYLHTEVHSQPAYLEAVAKEPTYFDILSVSIFALASSARESGTSSREKRVRSNIATALLRSVSQHSIPLFPPTGDQFGTVKMLGEEGAPSITLINALLRTFGAKRHVTSFPTVTSPETEVRKWTGLLLLPFIEKMFLRGTNSS